MVLLNVTAAPLNNVKFRQALAYATDRAGIVKAVCYDNCVPATSFLPLTTPYFDKGLKAYTYDVAKAKQLIAESGVATPVTLTVIEQSGANDANTAATLLKNMWAPIGVTLNLVPLDRATAIATDARARLSGHRRRLDERRPRPLRARGVRVRLRDGQVVPHRVPLARRWTSSSRTA